MNFATIIGLSLRSGYARSARQPKDGPLQNQPAGDPLIEGDQMTQIHNRLLPALMINS